MTAVGDQRLAHSPELSLLTRAISRDGSPPGIGMHIEGKIETVESKPSCFDVVLSNVAESRQMELPAKAALVVDEFHHGEGRVVLSKVPYRGTDLELRARRLSRG